MDGALVEGRSARPVIVDASWSSTRWPIPGRGERQRDRARGQLRRSTIARPLSIRDHSGLNAAALPPVTRSESRRRDACAMPSFGILSGAPCTMYDGLGLCQARCASRALYVATAERTKRAAQPPIPDRHPAQPSTSLSPRSAIAGRPCRTPVDAPLLASTVTRLTGSAESDARRRFLRA